MKNSVYSCIAGTLLIFCGCSVVQNNDSEYQEYISLLKASKNPEELKNSSLMHWESSSEYKIIYADKNIVSFRCESYSYTGGAHGMPDTKVGTIKNGKLLQNSLAAGFEISQSIFRNKEIYRFYRYKTAID